MKKEELIKKLRITHKIIDILLECNKDRSKAFNKFLKIFNENRPTQYWNMRNGVEAYETKECDKIFNEIEKYVKQSNDFDNKVCDKLDKEFKKLK